MHIFRTCINNMRSLIPNCCGTDTSPVQSPTSPPQHQPVTRQPTPIQAPQIDATSGPGNDVDQETFELQPIPLERSPFLSKKSGGTMRAKLTVQEGANTMARMNALPALGGVDFFEEVNALLDPYQRAQDGIENKVNLGDLKNLFLQHFEDKAVDFAVNFQKSNLRDFDMPIRTLRSVMKFLEPDQVHQCDQALFSLIHRVPQYARPIPNRAFCIWEGKEISQKSLANIAKFLKLNPDYSLTLLTSNAKSIVNALQKRNDGEWLTTCLKIESQDFSSYPLLESAINQENSGPFANHAAASDLARMFALVKKDESGNSGGLYFDVDCEFHKSLPQINAPFGLQTFWVSEYFMNGIMAAAPACEILENALEQILEKYDDRNKGYTWSSDLWVNKRAGIIMPKDNSNIDSTKGKGKGKPRKPQAQNAADLLAEEIEQCKKIGDKALANQLKEIHEDLLANPRQGLTEVFTVRPISAILMREFSDSCSDYSQNLNVFAGLTGSDNVFELPYEKDWANRSDFAGKRRASIA